MTYKPGILLVALALALSACAGPDGAADADEQPAAEAVEGRSVRVETYEARPVLFEDVVELTGSVDALNDARLSAQSAGTVVFLKPLGARVGRGEVVAQLDPGTAQASLQQAQAALEAAQSQLNLAEDLYRRQEPLYRDSIISALEFENVRSQRSSAAAGVAQAQAALAQAREGVKYTRITAPFAGIVEARYVEPGEQVMPGAPVARVVATGRVKVVAGVPERYAGDIGVGTAVAIDFRGYSVPTRRGRVAFVGSVINPDNRTFPIEVELDNPDARLKPEMVATVAVTRQEVEDALVVPQTAVIRDENGTALFVAREADGAAPVAERRAVAVGPSYGGTTVITSGLEAGDEVVVLGQTALTEGDGLVVTRHYETLEAAQRALRGEDAVAAN